MKKSFDSENLELHELYEVLKNEFDLLHIKHDRHMKRVYICIAIALVCMFSILVMEWIEVF